MNIYKILQRLYSSKKTRKQYKLTQLVCYLCITHSYILLHNFILLVRAEPDEIFGRLRNDEVIKGEKERDHKQYLFNS